MRRIVIGLFLSLAPLLGAACDEDSNGQSQLDIEASCSHLVQHCPTGYSWSYYVSDARERHALPGRRRKQRGLLGLRRHPLVPVHHLPLSGHLPPVDSFQGPAN
jgi:hypothetical protein